MAAMLVLPASAQAGTPLDYLTAEGPGAGAILPLTWGVLAISIAVVVGVGALLLAGVIRRRPTPPQGGIETTPGGAAWIAWGVGLSSLVLAATIVWTVMTLAAVDAPAGGPKLTVEVTGHQWWWEVRYPNADPGRTFTTADEIRIPAGEPVEVKLIGADVIHSFWVPALMGKTDIIPGQVNRTWIAAAKPGTYRGQCAEYCGVQHAHMALLVVAMPPEEFRAWRERQLTPAPEPASEAARAAEASFVARCGRCHTVRGTAARGRRGPDLSHLMSRRSLAAATLPNTTGHLLGWIADPQGVKPGSRMPRIDLAGPELQAIGAFLATLD